VDVRPVVTPSARIAGSSLPATPPSTQPIPSQVPGSRDELAPARARQAVAVAAPPQGSGGTVKQVIPFATGEERKAAREKLKADNPGDWQINAPDVNVFGQVVRAARDPSGPAVKTTPEQATQVAREFLAKNASVLGLEPEDLAALEPGQVLDTPRGLSVAFSGNRSPLGYGQFDGLTRHLAVNLTVGPDGKVDVVDNQGAALTASNMIPGLAVGTTPGLAGDGPEVRGAVLGQPLEWIEGGDEGIPEKRTDFGAVEPKDIKSSELTVYQDWNQPGKLTLTLGYQVTVSKGGHEWGFMVDAGTGKLIDSGQLGPPA